MQKAIWVVDADYPLLVLIRKFINYTDHNYGSVFTITSSDSFEDIAPMPAVIFVNIYSGSCGANLLSLINKLHTNTPIIVLVQSGDEETGRLAVKSGAQDYLIKNDITLALFQRTVLNAIERKTLLNKLYNQMKEAEKSLRIQNRKTAMSEKKRHVSLMMKKATEKATTNAT